MTAPESGADPTDLPTALTRMLRNVTGVHTLYATRSLVPTLVTAVTEAVRHEPVGMHLVRVDEGDDAVEVTVNLGVFDDEPAGTVCRRAHGSIVEFFTARGLPAPARVSVQIGRVG